MKEDMNHHAIGLSLLTRHLASPLSVKLCGTIFYKQPKLDNRHGLQSLTQLSSASTKRILPAQPCHPLRFPSLPDLAN